jgi:hypothetical protein
VFLDVSPFGDHPGGRLTFELYNDVVPATAENFRRLCIGNAGATHEGIPRAFKGATLLLKVFSTVQFLVNKQPCFIICSTVLFGSTMKMFLGSKCGLRNRP